MTWVGIVEARHGATKEMRYAVEGKTCGGHRRCGGGVVASMAAALAGEGEDSSGEGLAVAAPARPLAAVPIEQVNQTLVIAGSDFHSDHTNLVNVQSNGCIWTNQSDNLVAPVLVPDGAVLSRLEMEYVDRTATGTATLWITAYDADGLTDLAQVSTAGSVGRGTVGANFSHTVANDDEAISFNWRPNEVGVDLQLCSVRLRVHRAEPHVVG